MISIETFRSIALSFPETLELTHFEKTSFRAGKKIFATLSVTDYMATVKLSGFDQAAFCSTDLSAVTPVPNKWGLQGWTLINLTKITEELLYEMLTAAFFEVGGKKIIGN